MKIRSKTMACMTIVALTLVACSSEQAQTPFTPSPNFQEVGTSGIYIYNAGLAEKPTPSSGPGAPKITEVTAAHVGGNRFIITLHVENEEDIADAYLDFGEHGIYRVRPAPHAALGAGDFGAGCRDALASQKIPCTDACITACNCASCGDPAIEKNLKQSCAITCSANVHSGAIKSAPYNGSEETLAQYVYNGAPEYGLQGTAKQAGCDASQCTSAKPPAGTRTVKPWDIYFESPTIPQLTPLVAPQVQTADAVETSQPFAAAKVSVCKQGGTMPCR